jgi:hypothetical protein
MNKVACLLVAAALCGPCFAQDANKTQAAGNTKTVTITGTIKNFDEFKAAVVPGTTYIQFVPVAADGGFAGRTDSEGRAWAVSDLPKLPVPKNAAFSFTVTNIPPGRYFIAAQKLPGSIMHFFMKANGQTVFTIDFAADAKSPITINAGEMVVRIH